MARTLSVAEVPPVFAEISKAIYGDAVDVRELWDLAKNAPDSSNVHIDSDESAKRKGIAGGLLLGSAAETLGTARAVQAAGQKLAEPKVPSITGLRERTTLKSLGRRVRRLPDSKAGKVGEAALQAANLGVGLAAAHTLVSSTKDKQPVGKAFRLRPLNAGMLDHAPSARAIRRGPKPKPVQAVGKALPRPKLLRVTGEEFVNGRRPIQAQRAFGQHRTKPMGSMPRHRAEMPRRELTRTGKGTLVALPAGALGVAADRHSGSPVAKSVTWHGEISKIDSDKRQVFGWASVSEVNGQTVVDLQGDIAPIEEIEKSAYTYVLESRKGGDMHARVRKGLLVDWTEPKHTADLIESFVVTPEKLASMGLAPDALPLGWWVGFHVNDDEQWALVKNGERTGFSIHGAGRRETVAKAGNANYRHGERTQRAARRLTALPARRSGVVQRRAYDGERRAVDLGGYPHLARVRATHEAYVLRRDAHTAADPRTALARRQHYDAIRAAHAAGHSVEEIRDSTGAHLRAINNALRAISKSDARIRDRAHAAVHPPAPKLKPVSSSAIEAMGYLPQTRRLAIAMHSRPNEPYNYRVSPKQAREAENAPSLGSYYAREIRGKAKRATRYTLADRARLFADPPQVSKAMGAKPPATSPTARSGMSGKPTLKPLTQKLNPPATSVPGGIGKPLGLALNGVK